MRLRAALAEWLQIASFAFLFLWAWVPIDWAGWLVGFGVTLIMIIAAHLLSPSQSWLTRIFNPSRVWEEPAPPEHQLRIGESHGASPPNPPVNKDAAR